MEREFGDEDEDEDEEDEEEDETNDVDSAAEDMYIRLRLQRQNFVHDYPKQTKTMTSNS
jgi:hypothetical protein